MRTKATTIIKVKLLKLKVLIALTWALMTVAAPPPSAKADTFSPSRTDHQLHMLSTYGISFTFMRFLESRDVPRWKAIMISSLSTLAFAAGKERLYDKIYSNGDMVANTIGITTQAAMSFTFEL